MSFAATAPLQLLLQFELIQVAVRRAPRLRKNRAQFDRFLQQWDYSFVRCEPGVADSLEPADRFISLVERHGQSRHPLLPATAATRASVVVPRTLRATANLFLRLTTLDSIRKRSCERQNVDSLTVKTLEKVYRGHAAIHARHMPDGKPPKLPRSSDQQIKKFISS